MRICSERRKTGRPASRGPRNYQIRRYRCRLSPSRPTDVRAASVAPVELNFITAYFLTTMSEEQPLLPAEQRSTSGDVEAGGAAPSREKGFYTRCKEHTAETLETRPWHYTVTLLARIIPFFFLRLATPASDSVITRMQCIGHRRLCLRARRPCLHRSLRHLFPGGGS